MPGTTVPLGFPYPTAGDPLNGPAAIEALARAVDASVTSTLASAVAAREPAAWVILAEPQNILNNTNTNLVFSSVVLDNRGVVNLTASPVLSNVAENGNYLMVGTATFAANTAGFRGLSILQTGTVPMQERVPASPTTTFPTTCQVGGERDITTADTLGLQVIQTSGVTLRLTSAMLALWRVGG